jgi:hypothetical protein
MTATRNPLSSLSWRSFKGGWHATSAGSGSQYGLLPDTVGGGWVLSVWDFSKDDPEPLMDFPDADAALAWAEARESDSRREG